MTVEVPLLSYATDLSARYRICKNNKNNNNENNSYDTFCRLWI